MSHPTLTKKRLRALGAIKREGEAVPFERFVKQRRIYKSVVSIWKRGSISLGIEAVRQFHLEDFQYVVLYFEQKTDRIGMEFTNDNMIEGCVKLTHAPSACIISAKSFLQSYGAIPGNNKRYPLVWDAGEGLYIIELRSPLPPRGGRARARHCPRGRSVSGGSCILTDARTDDAT